MIESKRVEEMFALFSSTIPRTATTKQNKVIEKRLGISLDEFIGTSLMSLAQDCTKDEDSKKIAESYFDFIADAILYMKCETNDYPEVEFQE